MPSGRVVGWELRNASYVRCTKANRSEHHRDGDAGSLRQRGPRAGAPATAAPASPSNEDCLACHAEQVERAGGGSLPAVGHAFAGSVHGQLDMACTDCHADLQGKDLPHPVKLAAPDCAQCHEEAVKAYDQSVHAGARRLSPTASQAARCIDCHGVHDILSSKDPQLAHLPLQRGRHLQQVPR